VKPPSLRSGLIALSALALSGCIESAEPILTGAKPVFGQSASFQLYSLREGTASEPSQEQFSWTGTHYAPTGGAMTVDAFSAFPYEGDDYLIQSAPAKDGAKVEYALLHKLADGVFLARVIDEEDADAATRARLCAPASKYSCRISTREQLLALARATAARKHTDGGLVLRLPDAAAAK